ncbi:MAG: 4-hydroxy-tetrahydrodipicolinate synthase [Flavobacteriaceae bacterium]|nr:4-hydroxy-tetrahydrodipicolinate synthase [Flavobacteriaceae bacterium]
MTQWSGMGVALVTPFTEEGKVDVQALEKLVRYQLENGTDYLVVLGTTAETATLTKEEKELVKSTVIKVNNGKLPLVLGLGGNNTQQLIDEIQHTDLSHFDAILSVTPYYNKPSQEGLYQHYKAVAQCTQKPIILYNVPSRTGVNMLPETVFRLANEFEHIVGVKEATGNMVQAFQLLQHKSENFAIISGDDMIALPMTLAGGAGVISVIGQGYPKEFSDMIRFALQGKAKEAHQLHYRLMDSIFLIFKEGNPVGIKVILEKLGIGTATVRLPLVSATDSLRDAIGAFMSGF